MKRIASLWLKFKQKYLYVPNTRIYKWYRYKSDPDFCDEEIFQQKDLSVIKDGDQITIGVHTFVDGKMVYTEITGTIIRNNKSS